VSKLVGSAGQGAALGVPGVKPRRHFGVSGIARRLELPSPPPQGRVVPRSSPAGLFRTIERRIEQHPHVSRAATGLHIMTAYAGEARHPAGLCRYFALGHRARCSMLPTAISKVSIACLSLCSEVQRRHALRHRIPMTLRRPPSSPHVIFCRSMCTRQSLLKWGGSGRSPLSGNGGHLKPGAVEASRPTAA
jgi:hypothetical protein